MRFDIAMNDLPRVRMQIDERVEQLIGPGDHCFLRKRARLLRDDLGQVEAVNKLHHKECAVTFGKIVGDARQDRVMELRKQAGFLLKMLP